MVWVSTQELDQPEEPFEAFAAVLSDDERQRAARFYRPRDGQRFTVARGMLRRGLSRILGVASEEIQFAYAAHGKPMVASRSGGELAVQFNLAHSDHLAVLAVTMADPVGVDIERVRSVRSRDGIVAKHFSALEREAFGRFPDAERQEAFFRVWTRKEAIVKAIGTGLTLPLTSFDVSLEDRPTSALLAMRHPDHATQPWSLQALDAPVGFCAALAVARPGPIQVRYL